MKGEKVLYAQVILPIRFADAIFYSVALEQLESAGAAENPSLLLRRRAKVQFASKSYSGVIYKLYEALPLKPSYEIKPIESIEPQASVTPEEIKFWETIAEYYMCTIGEVYYAAHPSLELKQEGVNSKITAENLSLKIAKEAQKKKFPQIELTPAQQKALEEIKENIENKCVLLHGVTSSGKTELYITLAKEIISQGKNVLYLVPEIAMSRQLTQRLKEHFGERLATYHSSLTQAKKKIVRDALLGATEPIVILGTRSATLLPLKNLGLIVVDEEHDTSYKQDDPAPRYNGRDAALFLSKIHRCKILLGTATPSLETLYNCESGLYAKVELNEGYFKSPEPTVIVIDTIYARKTSQMRGSFSQGLINHLKQTLEKGEQAIIFSHLRSYSPFVICRECGEILRCPHCNVPLSYHKFSESLSCHYCEFKAPFDKEMECPNCKSKGTLEPSGAGSEKIEEELSALIPNARIARYDADIAKSSKDAEAVLREFANGETDILIGTQMLSKGFDFENVTLVAVVQTDTLLAQQDFRADEKALSLLSQLMGRCGRREKRGLFIVQTNNKHHPVIKQLREIGLNDDLKKEDSENLEEFMKERRLFNFPPYVRLIDITLRNKNIRVLNEESKEIVRALQINLGSSLTDITGPYVPRIEKFKDMFQRSVSVKLPRNKALQTTKRNITHILNSLKLKSKTIVDVDPL